jgi:hypothetical protein
VHVAQGEVHAAQEEPEKYYPEVQEHCRVLSVAPEQDNVATA